MCLILNLYRRTYWLANMVKDGKKIQGPESLREAAQGSARIRGDTLGIVGLGTCATLSCAAIALCWCQEAVIVRLLVSKWTPWSLQGAWVQLWRWEQRCLVSTSCSTIHIFQTVLRSPWVSVEWQTSGSHNALISEKEVRGPQDSAYLARLIRSKFCSSCKQNWNLSPTSFVQVLLVCTRCKTSFSKAIVLLCTAVWMNTTAIWSMRTLSGKWDQVRLEPLKLVVGVTSFSGGKQNVSVVVRYQIQVN